MGKWMKANNTIRLTGNRDFVEKVGDYLKTVLNVIYDSKAKPSTREKYRGNWIRYLRVK